MLKNARKPHKENKREVLLVEPLYTKQPRKFYIERKVKRHDSKRV